VVLNISRLNNLSSSQKKSRIDCGEMDDEKELLSSFLNKTLNAEVTSEGHNLWVNSELIGKDLERIVNKFIYHQHLNNEYWVALESGTIKVHRFKERKGDKKKKHVIQPSTIKHGW
jgi:hypothetical protein